MSRRKTTSKRAILPDSIWNSELLARFINILMCNGKKTVAETIVHDALETVMKRKQDLVIEDAETDEEQRAVALFRHALNLIRPTVEVRSCRVGGATYQVPVEVNRPRGEALAMRMLVAAAKQRSEHGMVARLTGELLDVFEGRGGALKKRDDIHRMAKANQAFAHYRW